MMLKIFELARLLPAKFDLKKVTSQAERVIKYFETLNELDTSKVDVTAHVLENKSHLREDIVSPFANNKKIVELAPKYNEPFIQVPKVM